MSMTWSHHAAFKDKPSGFCAFIHFIYAITTVFKNKMKSWGRVWCCCFLLKLESVFFFFYQDTGKHLSKPKQSRGLWVTFGHMSPLKSPHMGGEACGSAKLIGWFNRLVGKVCLFTFKTLVNLRQEFGISLQFFFFFNLLLLFLLSCCFC